MYFNFIKLFLRLSLAAGFLSAVADRFGCWHQNVAWGNWENFLKYTATLTPWLPAPLVPVAGILATAAEITFALALLVGFRTRRFAQLSGVLLLVFAVSMAGSLGIKPPLDYSVFAAAAAAFALSLLPGTFLEMDGWLARRSGKGRVE
ncbi:MAG TPA: DoxX family protein [Verrucomicrobiota bacterium]|nr:DoxX family protein [Verrucomicrobiota bacterium]HNT14976.1 DoxX family protein [Verrucomicrobiota bacterium]